MAKAKELAELLLKNPDFNVVFNFSEYDESIDWGLTIRKFDNIHICDVGYSSKTIVLNGDEIE